MTAKELTKSEFVKLIETEFDDPQLVIDKIDKWLRRGDGAAIYRNLDMSSRDLGLVKIVSYGNSVECQLVVTEAPQQLPDIGNEINWRYQLEATYKEQ